MSPRCERRRWAVLVALLAAFVGLVAFVFGPGQAGVASAFPPLEIQSTYKTLRLYGRSNMGPGSLSAWDPVIPTPTATPFSLEDPPYTDPMAVFNPERPEAPRKDSLTWDPVWMFEQETHDENWRVNNLYGQIKASGNNAAEKVWFRMWYEPEHWDKDLNGNGLFDHGSDGQPTAPVNPQWTNVDEWYPAVMQEFTYQLIQALRIFDNNNPTLSPQPQFGKVGDTALVFPIGMRAADVDDSDGYGLTSLDADFDGKPEIVRIESEMTLFERTGIAADFNGFNGRWINSLSPTSSSLTGQELAVLRLDPLEIKPGGATRIQFLDHMIEVREVFDNGAVIDIYYTGDKDIRWLDRRTLLVNDMALAGTNGPAEYIRAIRNGGTGTNACAFKTEPWFVYLSSIDRDENSAAFMVGRALGATYSAMEDGAGNQDRRPGDPWFLKRFYVDGHEYNVTAIYTRNGATLSDPITDCQITGSPSDDPTQFQFITIRTPVPKVDVVIEQHSVRLQNYPLASAEPRRSPPLSVMPPYNFEHYVVADVEELTPPQFVPSPANIGDKVYTSVLIGPVAPILQDNGPFPYTGAYPGISVGPYSDPRETFLFYVGEDSEPEFLGELAEKYGQSSPDPPPELEFWYAEQFWTLPWRFTEFVLPDCPRHPTVNGIERADLYLLTSAFTSPEAEYLQWIQNQAYQESGLDPNPLRFNLRWTGTSWAHDETQNTFPSGFTPRVKMHFNPHFDPNVREKKYKDSQGIRLYSRERTNFTNLAVDPLVGPGDVSRATDTVIVNGSPITGVPVEVIPYSDAWAPFNPQFDQAPRKDSLTFNPAYLAEFRNGGEQPLSSLYSHISIEQRNAREKVFTRMWYEPAYLQRLPTPSTTNNIAFPAVLQEYSYMLLDTLDHPSHGQPGQTRFVFPIGTSSLNLPKPVCNGGNCTLTGGTVGAGLETVDANFDGWPDIVTVHSEKSLADMTGLPVSFAGSAAPNPLDPDNNPLMDGHEEVVLTVENITLRKGESVQFLDHMITLKNIGSLGMVELLYWYTGGGSDPTKLQPQAVQGPAQWPTVGDMVIVNGLRPGTVRVPGGTSYLNNAFGAWFVYIEGINSGSNESVVLTIGRALGAARAPMYDSQGNHNYTPGAPWYLKRFYVDGHEYDVVAIGTVPSENTSPPDPFEFKYITIRTPVPKVPFTNNEDSQRLQDYPVGSSNPISVLPPFNMRHTRREDIRALLDTDFAKSSAYLSEAIGSIVGNVDPLTIRIRAESREPEFWGELKELLWTLAPTTNPTLANRWSAEQFHSVPDLYTELKIDPASPGHAQEKYLLTSTWKSNQSRLHYYAGSDVDPQPGTQTDQSALHAANTNVPAPNSQLTPRPIDLPITDRSAYFAADGKALVGNPSTVRVKFWYDPTRDIDLYVNRWTGYGPDPTSTPTNTPVPPTPTDTPVPPTPTNTPVPPTPTDTPVPPTPTDTPVPPTPTNTPVPPTPTNTPVPPTPTNTPTPITYAIRVNAGSSTSYVDGGGNTWAADKAYSVGSWGYVGGSTYTNPTSISGTSDPALYQTERWGMSAYRFDVPNGTYQVTLKLAEIYWWGSGQRVFDVGIEGGTVLSNFDIFATCGRFTACDRSFAVTVSDGRLDIEFSAAVNYPKVSAIEVISVGPYAIRVNAGSSASYVDGGGNTWAADKAYSVGSWGYVGGSTYANPTSISGTSDPVLYQTERWGMSAYRFDVPNGTYQVTLKLAEIYWWDTGQRVFDVGIEGGTVLSNFDIFASCGRFTACDRSFAVTVSDGRLDIEFSAAVNYPKVSAIEVISSP